MAGRTIYSERQSSTMQIRHEPDVRAVSLGSSLNHFDEYDSANFFIAGRFAQRWSHAATLGWSSMSAPTICAQLATACKCVSARVHPYAG